MKKINWDSTYSNPIPKKVNVRPGTNSYSSGREYLAKAFENEKIQREINENLAKALPAMEALLKCRLASKTPLKVVRPFVYASSEISHTIGSGGEVVNSSFHDVHKSLPLGTELTLTGIDHNLQEFIFVSQRGEEVALPYISKQQLMTQTTIYEDVIEFMRLKKE